MENIRHLRTTCTLTVLFIILMNLETRDACVLTSQNNLGPNYYDVNCEAQINCYKETNGLKSIIREWPDCSVLYDYLEQGETEFSRDFKINLQMYEVTDGFRSLNGIYELENAVITIKITDSPNLRFMPPMIKTMGKLSKIEITKCSLDSFERNKILNFKQLLTLNISHNSIAKLETGTEITSTSNVHTVDLSYNNIGIIPDEYFIYFEKLQYLDLSNNQISYITIDTFKGLSRLRTLILSHNELTQIKQSLILLVNCYELLLNNNHLDHINEYNFTTLTSLKLLNLSYNDIFLIDDKSFENIKDLEKVDVSNNNLTSLRRSYFMNNTKLQDIIFSNNNISVIEPDTFKNKNLTIIDIRHNKFYNSIKTRTFYEIRLNYLDLSQGNIKKICDKAFENSHIACLNISHNKLSNISSLAFQTIQHFTSLDLSYNDLNSLDFNTFTLAQLSVLKVQHNKINNIRRTFFINLTNLTKLDISNNNIIEIDPYSFSKTKLNTLEIDNIKIQGIRSHNFAEINFISRLDLVHTILHYIEDDAFFSMHSLTYLNCSHGLIDHISYNAFNQTLNLEIIDLSFNLLEHFNINLLSIRIAKELYLHNNKLLTVTDETFQGLFYLHTLTLSNNRIKNVYSQALSFKNNIGILDISSNIELFNGTMIYNVHIDTMNLKRTDLSTLSFEDTSNATVIKLDMSFGNISDLDNTYIYKLNKLQSLILGNNKICKITKNSLRNVTDLQWLDLSNNLINYIQPGSFYYANNLENLNLHNNQLVVLHFGVFDGLSHLNTLNISQNYLQTFDNYLFRDSDTSMMTLSLENNKIQDIVYDEFKNFKLAFIGGNLISCHKLTDTLRHGVIKIAAEHLDYSSENVEGISCKSNGYSTDGPIITLISKTAANISKMFSTINTSLDILKHRNEETSLNVSDISLQIDLQEKVMNITQQMFGYMSELQEYIKKNINVNKTNSVISESNASYLFDKRYLSDDKGVLLYLIFTCLLILTILFVYKFVKKIFEDRKSQNTLRVLGNKLLDDSVIEMS